MTRTNGISWTNGALLRALGAACALVALAPVAPAQQPDAGAWDDNVEVQKTPAPRSGTTVIEREGSRSHEDGGIRLVALLTADGQQIDQGIVWRVFQAGAAGSKSRLLMENREASPALNLQPGEYTVNAAFGRANLTKKIVVKAGTPATEQFVLNAGGLRLSAFTGGNPAPPGSVTYALFSDDRDQFANRTAVMSGAKPNLIIRLNAGIYHLVSTYGDANARVETDVTVEAGKLTETAIAHAGGKASFKLVMRSGGEAVPDTRWIIQTDSGEVVKESVGALPAHLLAPGSYTVVAASAGQLFKKKFEVKDGEITSVEVLMSSSSEIKSAEPPPTEQAPLDLPPSLDLKNP